MIKPSILLVDDDREFRESLARYLSSQYVTLSASNGCEAVTKIHANQNIRLIVSDMEMPEMDGMELLEKVNFYKWDIPTIFLTGSSTLETAVDAMRLGAYDYLTKPVDIHQLEHSIKRALHRCHAFI